MERALEEAVRVEASPERVVEMLSNDPAGVLTGKSCTDTGTFAAEIAVPLGGGTSLAHEVDVVFDRLPDAGAVGRFGLSWRAHDLRRAFPVFSGTLEIQRDGSGSRLRLSGQYSLPLGAVGAVGDLVLGHRVASRSVQDLLHATAARIDAVAAREDAGTSVATPQTTEVTIGTVRSELYLG